MIKTRGPSGTASVTFTLVAEVGASHAAICGEWNNWSPDVDVMEPDGSGGWVRRVELEPGRMYRFRYLLDGHRWENDWAADSYVPNDHGGNDSVVDLIALAEDVPSASNEAGADQPAMKAAAKAATPPKKAAPRKAAPAKKAVAKKAGTGDKGQPAKKAAKKAAKKSTE